MHIFFSNLNILQDIGWIYALTDTRGRNYVKGFLPYFNVFVSNEFYVFTLFSVIIQWLYGMQCIPICIRTLLRK